VIDFMFLWTDSNEIDNYIILLESRSPLDYVSLMTNISIDKEYIQEKRWIIIWNSKKEEKFVTKLTIAISSIDTSKIPNIEFLEAIHLLQGQIMYHENILKSLWKMIGIYLVLSILCNICINLSYCLLYFKNFL